MRDFCPLIASSEILSLTVVIFRQLQNSRRARSTGKQKDISLELGKKRERCNNGSFFFRLPLHSVCKTLNEGVTHAFRTASSTVH
jgi:hypothetical protein